MKKLFLLTLLSLFIPFTVTAHDAPSGWMYDQWCCDGRDCAQIPSSAVKIVRGGYIVTLDVGDHPMVTYRHEIFIGNAGVRQSMDESYHLCLFPNEDTLRCFYKPFEGY